MKNRYLVFVGMGFELIGVIIATLYLGKALDENFGTRGAGIALMPMLGLVGWIVHIVALTKSVEKEDLKE